METTKFFCPVLILHGIATEMILEIIIMQVQDQF